MNNLDKRTEDITVGVNKMTATATRQIDLAGRSITDLARNPQRFLFGGSSPEPASIPAASRRRQPQPQSQPQH
jgi:hypothetical protein